MSFFIQPNGGSLELPANYFRIAGGDPSITLAEAVRWSDGTESATLPYTSDGIYGFELIDGNTTWETTNLNSKPQIIEFVSNDITRFNVNFYIQDCVNLEKFEVPNLIYVGSEFFIYNTLISELALPSLDYVGRTFSFRNNPNLTTVDLSSLREVARAASNRSMEGYSTAITELNLPLLERAGYIIFYSNPNMTSFDAPILTSSLGILLQNSGLETFNLPELVSLTNGGFEAYNTNLTVANLPKLDRTGTTRLDNLGLTSVDLGLLRDAYGELRLNGNNFTTLDLSSLTQVFRQFNLSNNLNLTSISLPILDYAAIWTNQVFDLRNTSITSLDLPLLDQSGTMRCDDITTLTSINVPLLRQMTSSGYLILNGSSISSLNIPELTSGSIDIRNTNVTGTFSAPKLVTTGEISISGLGLTAINLPLLQTMTLAWNVGGNNFTTIDLPELTTATRGITISGMPSVTTVNLPKLTTIGLNQAYHFNMSGLGITILDVPLLETSGRFLVQNNPNLTTINAPLHADAILTFIDNNPNLVTLNYDSIRRSSPLDITNNALPQSEVDDLLTYLATGNGGSPVVWTGTKDLDIRGGTNAAPSAVGEGHIDTLRADGWTVNVTGGY